MGDLALCGSLVQVSAVISADKTLRLQSIYFARLTRRRDQRMQVCLVLEETPRSKLIANKNFIVLPVLPKEKRM